MTENYVDAVFSFFALACLIGLFYSAWQSLIVDAVRQRMFDIRDKVFLWAFDNGRLNDLAYKEFREAANAAIRHFENVSLLKLIVMNSLFDIKKQTSSPKNIFLQDSHLKDEFHKLTKVAVRGLMAR